MSSPGPTCDKQRAPAADEASAFERAATRTDRRRSAHDWTRTFVSPGSDLRKVLQTIDAAELQIAMVVDDDTRLLGVITDGDVRRALLRGHGLDCRAADVMTRDPLTAGPSTALPAIERMMYARDVHQVPIVDDEGVLVGLALHGKLLPRERLDTDVVLMVGGFGRRLGALTTHVPKPLLRLGDKPILEIILDNLLTQGFYRFHLAVHFRADLVERHFGNGGRWGAEIHYLRESQPLGTCGALRLLDPLPSHPILVMNGDLITKLRFADLLRYHRAHGGVATVVVREHEVTIPFGVVRLDERRVRALQEKPTERFQVNAGVYVLEPAVLPLIPEGERFDMTNLLQRLIERDMGVVAFSVRGPWLDIGGNADLQQAHADFDEHWREPEDPA